MPPDAPPRAPRSIRHSQGLPTRASYVTGRSGAPHADAINPHKRTRPPLTSTEKTPVCWCVPLASTRRRRLLRHAVVSNKRRTRPPYAHAVFKSHTTATILFSPSSFHPLGKSSSAESTMNNSMQVTIFQQYTPSQHLCYIRIFNTKNLV